MKPHVEVLFEHADAKEFGMPKYQYEGDSGADLHTYLPKDERADGKTIFPGERALLATGIRIKMAEGVWGRIVHRSSTEKKTRLRVVEGTIDNGYTGPLFVQVSNDNTYPISIKHGDRLAQLILHPVVQGMFYQVHKLGETDRGQNGFGSTGHGGHAKTL